MKNVSDEACLRAIEIQGRSAHVTDLIRDFIKIGMLHGITSGDSLRRIALQHPLEEVKTKLVKLGNQLAEWYLLLSMLLHLFHVLVVQGKFCKTMPHIRGWCASDLEDLL